MPLGRPKDSKKEPEVYYSKVLAQAHITVPSSRWDHKNARGYRMFPGSKRKTWETHTELQRYSYSQFCRSTRRGKTGVVKYVSQTDKCDYCAQWDLSTQPSIEKVYVASESELEHVFPAYFSSFNRSFEGKCRAESVPYCERFIAYVEQHKVCTFRRAQLRGSIRSVASHVFFCFANHNRNLNSVTNENRNRKFLNE